MKQLFLSLAQQKHLVLFGSSPTKEKMDLCLIYAAICNYV